MGSGTDRRQKDQQGCERYLDEDRTQGHACKTPRAAWGAVPFADGDMDGAGSLPAPLLAELCRETVLALSHIQRSTAVTYHAWSVLLVRHQLGQCPEGILLTQEHEQDGHDLVPALAVAHLLTGMLTVLYTE